MEGSLPLGNIQAWRRPSMSVSWLSVLVIGCVSITIMARQLCRLRLPDLLDCLAGPDGMQARGGLLGAEFHRRFVRGGLFSCLEVLPDTDASEPAGYSP